MLKCSKSRFKCLNSVHFAVRSTERCIDNNEKSPILILHNQTLLQIELNFVMFVDMKYLLWVGEVVSGWESPVTGIGDVAERTSTFFTFDWNCDAFTPFPKNQHITSTKSNKKIRMKWKSNTFFFTSLRKRMILRFNCVFSCNRDCIPVALARCNQNISTRYFITVNVNLVQHKVSNSEIGFVSTCFFLLFFFRWKCTFKRFAFCCFRHLIIFCKRWTSFSSSSSRCVLVKEVDDEDEDEAEIGEVNGEGTDGWFVVNGVEDFDDGVWFCGCVSERLTNDVFESVDIMKNDVSKELSRWNVPKPVNGTTSKCQLYSSHLIILVTTHTHTQSWFFHSVLRITFGLRAFRRFW